MKTLKFMLAAATAIGLASVTQADEYNTTGFEKLTVGTSVTTGVQDNRDGYSYFYYAGENPDDNESVITNGTPNIARPRGASAVDSAREKILQVSTGPEPLLRTYQGFTGQSPVAATDLTADTYVDTLVQFTVTPYTDTVTNTAADKLMIYLKESVTTNELGVITDWDTNLVVIGGCVVGAEDTLAVAQEYVVKGVHVEGQHQDLKVEPHKWYRLTVKAIVNAGGRSGTYPGFCVYVDGKLCYFDVAAWNEDNRNFKSSAYESANTSKELVLSLLANGSNPASLQGVGFAGEGKVDDIVFSELDPFATVYDFTFAFDPQKVSAVTYTVGGVSKDQAGSYEVEAGTAVQITSVTYADAWLAGTIDAVNMSDPVAGVYTVTNAGASLTINPEVFFPRTSTADQDGTADHPYEVADAAALSALQKGVLAGKNLTGKNFVLTGNIDMTGVTGFWGIGWFSSSDSKDASITASGDIPFTGVFDGAGYTISNVTLVRHNYAGLFNNVSGTVKNLTVQNIGFSGTCSEWGCAIVGNAAAGSLLSNLTAAASTVWGDNANHNVAGIVVRPIGSATIYGCVNNADITASGKRVGGVAAFVGSGSTGTVFDSCTNTAAIVSSNGTRGVGGILGCAEGNTTATATIIRNCADFGSETAQAEGGHAGAIVGSNWNGSYTYTDDGGNTFKASTVDCGYVKNAVFGRAYAVASTIDATDYLTTVKAADLAAGNTYTLLANVAASGTPVFTLAAAGDTIAFDTVRGFTFAGTVDGDGYLTVTPATVDTVTTYTAVLPKYEITFVSGEGAATNVQEVDAGTTPVPPTAAVVAGKTFTAWSPVVAIATAPATYTATYDWVTYTITYKNADDSVFTDWASEYTAPTSFTAETPVALPVAANVDLGVVGVQFNGWTNGTGSVTSTAGLYADLVVFADVTAVVQAGWDADPEQIQEGKTAAQEYPALAESALATANAKQLTTWATANSINFSDVAADTTGTLTEAFLLNCATADVAQEKEEFVLDITVGADGTISVSLPDGKSYNGTLQMKGSNNLSTWDPVNSASSSYKFYKYELSL